MARNTTTANDDISVSDQTNNLDTIDDMVAGFVEVDDGFNPDAGIGGDISDEFTSLADLDWSGVNTADAYPVLEKGNYPGYIEKSTLEKSQERSLPMMVWAWVFTDQKTGEQVKFKQYITFDVQDKTSLARAKLNIERVYPNLPANFNPVRDYGIFTGRNVFASLDIDKDTGYGRKNRITKIIAASGPDERAEQMLP